MTMYSISSSAGQFQNSKGCFLGVNSTLPFGSRWWGRSILWVFPEVPKWLNVFGLIGWFETFSEVLHFTFEIYSSSASSSQLQVVCQYLIFFLTGSVIVIDVSHVDIHCFLQRTQGVLGADRHIVSCADNSISFDIFGFTIYMWSLFSFLQQECQRSRLHCIFSSPMMLFFPYFRTWLCAVRVFRFHIVGKYSGGSAEVWTKVVWTLCMWYS